MKVLMISEYWPPFGQGGGEISAEKIAESLAESGLEVSVLTSFFDGAQKEELKNKVKIYRYLKTGKSPKSFFANVKRNIIFPGSVKRETKRLVNKEKFDVIHYFNTSSVYGKLDTKIKSFVHINSPVFFCPKGTLMYQDKTECHYKCTPSRFLVCFIKSREFSKLKNKWYFKFNPFLHAYLYFSFKLRLSKLKKFDFYMPVSYFMNEKLIENKISANKIKIIPNIVDLTPSKNKISSKIPKILFLSAYLENKGVWQLLKALKSIDNPYECNFYGSGELREKMIEFVRSNKLDDKIKINNQIKYEETEKVMKEHDIIIQPSLVAEAMPRTVIEAMALKKAVITTNRGGMKTVIENNKEGLIIDPEKDGELREAIIKSFNITLRKKLGEAACKKINKIASKKVIAKEISSSYKSILDD